MAKKKKITSKEKGSPGLEQTKVLEPRVRVSENMGDHEIFIKPLSPLLFLPELGQLAFIPLVLVIVFISLYFDSLETNENSLFLYLGLIWPFFYYYLYHRFIKWRYPGLRIVIFDHENYAIWTTGKDPEKPQHVGITAGMKPSILNVYRSSQKRSIPDWFYLYISLPDNTALQYSIYRFNEKEKKKVEDFLEMAGLDY